MSQYQPGSDGLLKPLAPWITDPDVSEILLNQPQAIWIEKNGALTQHEVPALSSAHLMRLFQLIANENRQRLSAAQPLLSGSLGDGSRIQLCLPPAAKHPTFAIRRQVKRGFSLADYQQQQFYQAAKVADKHDATVDSLPECEKQLIALYKKQEWDSFIRHAISQKKTIIISGGTSSGKTTYLNACLQAIDPATRLILLEDTRELTVSHKNCVSLLASKGDQGEAKVSMQDLLQCSLRLRPDRIIMGEIRGREILDFVGACSTGHDGSMTSIHANNPRMAFMRMTQMYKLNHVPSMSDQDILRELDAVIDIIVQVEKTPKGRQVQSIYYRYGPLAMQE
ncbi:MAG: P-type DNA transfer ATPase VirB11 [Coxiellaceae bacterium]|nr:P-type DNA transfer ATPase VirB11 [Coxiellaceae bacterium]